MKNREREIEKVKIKTGIKKEKERIGEGKIGTLAVVV